MQKRHYPSIDTTIDDIKNITLRIAKNDANDKPIDLIQLNELLIRTTFCVNYTSQTFSNNLFENDMLNSLIGVKCQSDELYNYHTLGIFANNNTYFVKGKNVKSSISIALENCDPNWIIDIEYETVIRGSTMLQPTNKLFISDEDNVTYLNGPTKISINSDIKFFSITGLAVDDVNNIPFTIDNVELYTTGQQVEKVTDCKVRILYDGVNKIPIYPIGRKIFKKKK
jgi:hypothetical protein